MIKLIEVLDNDSVVIQINEQIFTVSLKQLRDLCARLPKDCGCNKNWKPYRG